VFRCQKKTRIWTSVCRRVFFNVQKTHIDICLYGFYGFKFSVKKKNENLK
jgi:hypothetical protein